MAVKYYTWKDLDKLYERYEDAKNAANKKGLKDVYPPGFESMEEAEAFRRGELDKYIREDKYKPFEAAQYDAIIYTDGSFDSVNNIAAYGLIIFFRDEAEPWIESGQLKDVDAVKYKIVRYDGCGNEMKDDDNIKEIVRDNEDGGKTEAKGFVSTSESITAEFSGAMRALEICCHKSGVKKLLIIYDCENVKTEYENREMPDSDDGHIAAAYRKLLRDLKDTDIQFIKIDSHKQYLIDADEYPHAVYNDLVDILARAELGIKINPTDNPNVFRAISGDFKRFSDIGAVTREGQREHARMLVKTVLNKFDGIFRPIFPKA